MTREMEDKFEGIFCEPGDAKDVAESLGYSSVVKSIGYSIKTSLLLN